MRCTTDGYGRDAFLHRIVWQRLGSKVELFLRLGYRCNGTYIPSARQSIYQEPLFRVQFHYLEAERTGPRILFEKSDYLVRRLRRIGAKGEYAAHFLNIFRVGACSHYSVAASAAPKPPSLRDQVEAWLGEISPGTRLHDTSHPNLDVVSLEYSFTHGKQVLK